MGFFRREQHTKIVRDEQGNVLRLEKTGDRMGESRTPVSDKLMEQQPRQKKKPSRLIGFAKKVDNAIVNYNRDRNPLYGKPHNVKKPSRSNANPFSSVFDTGMSYPKKKSSKPKTQYVIVGGKAYPKGKTKTSKAKKRKTRRSNDPFDFDMFDNWRF